jgi:hypothetical protein
MERLINKINLLHCYDTSRYGLLYLVGFMSGRFVVWGKL